MGLWQNNIPVLHDTKHKLAGTYNCDENTPKNVIFTDDVLCFIKLESENVASKSTLKTYLPSFTILKNVATFIMNLFRELEAKNR